MSCSYINFQREIYRYIFTLTLCRQHTTTTNFVYQYRWNKFNSKLKGKYNYKVYRIWQNLFKYSLVSNVTLISVFAIKTFQMYTFINYFYHFFIIRLFILTWNIVSLQLEYIAFLFIVVLNLLLFLSLKEHLHLSSKFKHSTLFRTRVYNCFSSGHKIIIGLF